MERGEDFIEEYHKEYTKKENYIKTTEITDFVENEIIEYKELQKKKEELEKKQKKEEIEDKNLKENNPLEYQNQQTLKKLKMLEIANKI